MLLDNLFLRNNNKEHLKLLCRQIVNKDSVGLLNRAAVLAVSIAPSRGGWEKVCHRLGAGLEVSQGNVM